MPFNPITQKLKYRVKNAKGSTIFVIRLFCIKTFPLGVFFCFIHDFRRLYPKKIMNST